MIIVAGVSYFKVCKPAHHSLIESVVFNLGHSQHLFEAELYF